MSDYYRTQELEAIRIELGRIGEKFHELRVRIERAISDLKEDDQRVTELVFNDEKRIDDLKSLLRKI